MTTITVDKKILQRVLPIDHRHEAAALLPEIVGISIDSRTIKPGDVFFALRGETHDGHHHIDEACRRQASMIVLEAAYQECSPKDKVTMVLVKDTLRAFSDVAASHLALLNPIRIAVTGSNGKTTTKEMIRAALGRVLGPDRVYASYGNKNNHFGVPLSALEVTKQHRVAIFELGMNHPGEITNLCQIVSPNIGIITNIGCAHEGNFIDGIDGIQRAKGELFQSVSENRGTIVVNADDERVVFEACLAKSARQIVFGSNNKADVKITSHEPYSVESHSQAIAVSVDQETPIRFHVPLAGAHQAINAIGALAVVRALGLSVRDASLGFMDMKETKGRMNVFTSPLGFTVINDAYNANPASMKAGVLASMDIPAKRRIAAIGAMGELGDKSAAYHFELGKLLAHHFDYIFICGQDGRHAVQGAKSEGMLENQIQFKASSTELVDPIKALLQANDLIFVKGSLSANMLVIANALQEM